MALPQRNNQRNQRQQRENRHPDFVEKVVNIARTSKVVKGGRRFNFTAYVVVGNQKGIIGFGSGKSKEVAEATKKATERAHKHYHTIKMYNSTVPHRAMGIQDGGKVMLRPASPGTGLIAGGAVRAVLEAAGVKDILTKSMGSSNAVSVAKATINALLKMRSAQQIHALLRGGAQAKES